MRDDFLKRLLVEAKKNKKLILLTADLGFGALDKFKNELPDQYLNIGIAEQNMTSIAAGLAKEGFKVLTYSIANFNTLRCLEQIRNDICYPNLDVTIVSTGGGFSYGQLGMSHFAIEDLSILRTFPNLNIFVPSCKDQAADLINNIFLSKSPKYIRLDKGNEYDKKQYNKKLENGLSVVKLGGQISIFVIGSILKEAIEASDILEKKNIKVNIIQIHTFKPLDKIQIKSYLKSSKYVVTLEENMIINGLGDCISSLCMEIKERPKKIKKIGIPDEYPKVVGDQGFLRKLYKLDSESIANEIVSFLD